MSDIPAPPPDAPDFSAPPPPPVGGSSSAPVAIGKDGKPIPAWKAEYEARQLAEAQEAAKRTKEQGAIDERLRLERIKKREEEEARQREIDRLAEIKRRSDAEAKEKQDRDNEMAAAKAERAAFAAQPAQPRVITYSSKYRPIAANIAILTRAGFVISSTSLTNCEGHPFYFQVYTHASLPGSALLPIRDALELTSKQSRVRSDSEWDVA